MVRILRVNVIDSMRMESETDEKELKIKKKSNKLFEKKKKKKCSNERFVWRLMIIFILFHNNETSSNNTKYFELINPLYLGFNGRPSFCNANWKLAPPRIVNNIAVCSKNKKRAENVYAIVINDELIDVPMYGAM